MRQASTGLSDLSNPMFRHCVYQLRQQLSSRQAVKIVSENTHQHPRERLIESQNAPNPQASQMPLQMCQCETNETSGSPSKRKKRL
eukprot:749235-Hanusia_phi.AAC.1